MTGFDDNDKSVNKGILNGLQEASTSRYFFKIILDDNVPEVSVAEDAYMSYRF